MDWQVIADNYPAFLAGASITLQLVLLSLIMGIMLSLPLTLLRNSSVAAWRLPVCVYTYIFRGTPMLVQMLLIYYGLGGTAWMQEYWREGHAFWLLFRDPWFCALLAFVLNTTAYTTEIIAGSIRTMPRGEVEAAIATGMRSWQVFAYVLLPQGMRRSLPAYSNEVVFMLQGSAVASVITLVDITGVARNINARFFTPFEAFITAAIIYVVLTYAIAWLFRRLERRWLMPWQSNSLIK